MQTTDQALRNDFHQKLKRCYESRQHIQKKDGTKFLPKFLSLSLENSRRDRKTEIGIEWIIGFFVGIMAGHLLTLWALLQPLE